MFSSSREVLIPMILVTLPLCEKSTEIGGIGTQLFRRIVGTKLKWPIGKMIPS